MPVTNFPENQSLKEQNVPFLLQTVPLLNGNINPTMNHVEQNYIDAAVDENRGSEIRISNQDFRTINQIINQKCQKLYSALEEIGIQQTVGVGNHCSLIVQNFQQGLFRLLSDEHVELCQHINRVESKVTENENFQFKLLEQYEVLIDEIKSLKNSLSNQKSSMDLTREPPPGPDQDSNGCLDGDKEMKKIREENRKKLLKDQNKLMQEIKNAAQKNAVNASTTLQNEANNGDMNKFNVKSKKPVTNAEQVPGSPENAIKKNKISSNSNHSHQKEQMDNEFDEFYAPTYPKVDNVPIVGTDPTTGRQKVRMEEKHFYAEDDYGFDPSPSAKKRMRKRRTNDAKRAKCEVVVHNLEETVREEYSSNEQFWVAESNKFLQWIQDEMHPEHLGDEVGIDLGLGDIVKTSRIYVLQEYFDDGKPLPMIVQLIDEETANKVKKAMYAAGCFERRIRRNYGRYKKVGDKKKDKEIDAILPNLPYGRPSTTKEERDLAKKKKEYKLGQSFKRKTTYQEFKKKMDVDYTYLNEKYTKSTENGVVSLNKKPKTVSKRATNKEKGNENDQINDNDPDDEKLYNPNWFVGDYCRVKCPFDGQIHEAKLIKQNTENPLVFKLDILGYGYKDEFNCSLFKKTRGKKAQKAQIEAVAKNNNEVNEKIGNDNSDKTSTEKLSPNLRQEEGENELKNEVKVLKELEENSIEIANHPVQSQEEGVTISVVEINSKSKDRFQELKDELESGFEADIKTIDNLDISDSSLLRDNTTEIEDNVNYESEEDTINKTLEIVDINDKTLSLNNTAIHSEEAVQNEDIAGFTKRLFDDLVKNAKKNANASFNYEFIVGEGFEKEFEKELNNIREKSSDTKATINHQEIFERMVTRSRSLNKDNLILKPTSPPLRRTTSVQNKKSQK